MIPARFAVACLLLSAIGCATLQPVQQPAQFIPKNHPPLVYVTYTDQSIVPVAQPRVSGDSLLGTWQGLGEAVAVPLTQVQSIQAVQKDKKKTTWLIVGISAFTVAGTVAVLAVTGPRGEVCVSSQGQTPEVICP